jgi:hypothetical protein
MIDESTRLRFVVSGFRDLESQLADCMGYIPFIDSNKYILSPKFIPIISESCGFIESIFKESEGNKGRRYALKDYAKLLEPRLELENTITVFLNSPIFFLNPFKLWTNSQPTWWKAYNMLKHHRLSSYEIATFDNAIMAMAALHQVISRSIDFVPSLISDGWFNSDSDDVGELIVARIIEAGVPIHVIPVESRFFVSPLRDNFVSINDGDTKIEECDFSNRVKCILSVYEWLTPIA